MLRRLICIMILTVTASVALAACQPAAAPTGPAPEPKSTAAPVALSKWETTLAAAKKEGKVSVYALWGQNARVAISQAFQQKFGIEAEFTSFNRGAEMLAKVKTEQNAGLNIPDVFGSGGGTFINAMKPAGVLGRIKPLLFLPEAIDPKMWKGGQLVFIDNDGTVVATLATANRFLVYNTDLVKPGEITTYEDLLKPQFKGKISINDPRVSGSGNAAFAHLAGHVYEGNIDKARDYLMRLVGEQKPEIIRDNRLQVEVVARGKHAVTFGARIATQAEFIQVGAPLAQVMMDKVFLSHADSMVGVPRESPHPNAALVFINWLLTKEGHAIFVKSTGNPGLRLDAPTEGIPSLFFPTDKEKLYFDTEEFTLFREEMKKLAQQVIAEAEKK